MTLFVRAMVIVILFELGISAGRKIEHARLVDGPLLFLTEPPSVCQDGGPCLNTPMVFCFKGSIYWFPRADGVCYTEDAP